jgi:hypothetical protein
LGGRGRPRGPLGHRAGNHGCPTGRRRASGAIGDVTVDGAEHADNRLNADHAFDADHRLNADHGLDADDRRHADSQYDPNKFIDADDAGTHRGAGHNSATRNCCTSIAGPDRANVKRVSSDERFKTWRDAPAPSAP